MKNRFAKKFAPLMSLALSAVMCFGSFAACGPANNNSGSSSGNNGGKTYDNENDALVFSSAAVDKVFNPFFSTSGADSNVIGMTQLGMLGNDKYGNYTWGDNEEVITKDLGIVYDKTSNTTTYYFALKNDIKFSNGSPLTIKDVLFNYYVYLDPAYTGSSTIYSTDIVGLKAYRTQSTNEDEQKGFYTQFQTKADARVEALSKAVEEIVKKGDIVKDVAAFRAKLSGYGGSIAEDFDLVAGTEDKKGFFREELESDFTAASGSYADIKFYDKQKEEVKGVSLKNDVEAFLYNEGIITWNKDSKELGCSVGFDAIKNYTKEQAIDLVYKMNMEPKAFVDVIAYWQTASKLNEYLVNAEMEAFFKEGSGSRAVKNISGIKFANKDEKVTFTKKKSITNSKGEVSIVDDGTVTYAKAEHNADGSAKNNEVLSITIKGVDPKAIWNFGIGVAPMYYYSDKEHIDKFDYEENFGVEFASQTFLNDTVNSSKKIGVPVGAGAYAASKVSGGIDNVEAGDFCDKGYIYYERNPYYNMGKGGVEKTAPDGKDYKVSKIKKVRYKVVTEQTVMNDLESGSIDFAEPNAKPETYNRVRSINGLDAKKVSTAGYGYIGINAAKVPGIHVRRAIMYTMNTKLCVDYYKGQMAQQIYRSMSKNNWAYPEDSTAYYPYIGGQIPANLNVVDPDYKAFVQSKGKKAGQTFTADEQKEFIQSLVKKDGYNLGGDGVYAKSGETLKYTFTIAGEESDHPAWDAMSNSAKLLNRWGFDITVTTNANALSLLSSGGLTVWAAAWSSTIDPDMYQVYHKDSKATSVLNWGYKQILQNASNKYKTELSIVNELSTIIDAARKTEDQKVRKEYYSRALDKVMELAVELPTYQRDDLFAYNTDKIDTSTFNQDPTSYKGLTSNFTAISLRTK